VCATIPVSPSVPRRDRRFFLPIRGVPAQPRAFMKVSFLLSLSAQCFVYYATSVARCVALALRVSALAGLPGLETTVRCP